VAYRADIEIGVRGTRQLEQLRSEITKTSVAAQSLSDVVSARGSLVQNVQNYQSQLNRVSNALSLVTIGTKAETKAIGEYVTVLGQANAARQRQQLLIDNEIKKRQELARIQKLTAAGVFETTRFKQPIGPQQSPLQGQSSPVNERIARTIAQRKDEQRLQAALLQLQLKSAALDNKKLITRGQINATLAKEVQLLTNGIRITSAQYASPIGPALPPKGSRGAAGNGIGKGISGAVSNAAIGGAFPLLFGQSGSAAAGGALGGIAGSFLGPSGGFAGSLVGTILGEKLGQGNQVKQLGEDIGFSAEQTKMLGTAFQQAGRDFDKFQGSVSTIQGLSLSIEDQARAIQLASSLTENYKGKIDKVTNAFANALSTGKVTQGTLNQLTGQGIPIQQALADKYNVSRDAILQMAKDGKISVQDLIDTLVKVGNEGIKSSTSQQKAFNAAYTNIEEAGNRLATTLTTVFGGTAEDINNTLNKVLVDTLNYIADLIDGFNEIAKVVGPVIKYIVDGYNTINTAVWNVINSIPGLTQGMLQFVATVLGPLGQVALLVNSIRGVGATAKGKLPPAVTPKPVTLQTLTAPSQMAAAGSKDNSAEKAAKAAEREAARVANIVRDQAALTQQKQLQAQYSQAIFTAEIAKDEVLKIQLQREREIGEISLQYSKQLNDEKAKGNSAAVKEAFTKTALVDVQLVELKVAQQLAELQIKTTEAYTNITADLQYQLDLKAAVTEQDRIQLELAYEAAKLKKDNPLMTPGQIDTITKQRASLAAPKTDAQTIAGRVGQLQDEIKEMTKLSTVAITAADGIGNAFANSFKSLIDGSMSAREALSSFFKDVASMFLEMAAQIIAKQMTMIILQTILKALGAVAGAAGGATPTPGATPQMTPGAIVTPTGFSGQFAGMAAKGAYFSNGVAAFANGGIVGSPTMFRFANGGTTQAGLMGEAGPEAIMPLSRGAGGKLGVNASGLREAMGGAPGMGGSPVLNMSFETTRFGDTDYVSRDQLEAAMAQTRRQASSDGAKRGMSMTLDRLQQSPQTRSRVGLR
jgi:tape measure domain-containing protein